MRAPAWMTIRRNRNQPTPGQVEVTIDVDTSQFAAGQAAAGRSAAQGAQSLRLLANALNVPMEPLRGARVTHHPANQVLANALANTRATQLRAAKAMVLRKAGMEMRWYVQGAMGPQWSDPGARDSQFQRLVKQGRTQDALAFLRGWVEHHPEPELDCRRACQYGADFIGGPNGSVSASERPCGMHRDYARFLDPSADGFSVEREVDGWWPGYVNARYLNVPQRWIVGVGR